MATNKHNNLNNEEEHHQEFVRNIQKSISTTFGKVKKSVDNSSDPIYCLSFMTFIRAMYDRQVIPLLKEDYSNDPSHRGLYLSRANYAHEMFDGLYQHILKRVEELGIPSSDFPSSFPKSLEKLTFPENN
jgi:hypothetical protein